MASTDLAVLKKESLIDRENNILSEHFKVQKEELRETDNIRIESVIQMRNWIGQNQDIEGCLEDDNFLLRFLRVRKYSVPMAQQTLLKYLNFRQKFSNVLCNLDYVSDKRTKNLIDNGYVYVSPFRDRNGRRVIIYNFSKVDVQTVTSLDIQRADALTFEVLMDDEECQVMGVTHLIQADNMGPSFIPIFCTKDFGYLIKWGEQSFPIRHKSFLVNNISLHFKYIYDLAKALISPKLRKRIWMNESAQTLSEQVGKKCLPLELGGTVPAKNMIALWKEELLSKRERLLSIDNIKLLSDRGIITRRRGLNQDDTGCGSLAGSFRKLDID